MLGSEARAVRNATVLGPAFYNFGGQAEIHSIVFVLIARPGDKNADRP